MTTPVATREHWQADIDAALPLGAIAWRDSDNDPDDGTPNPVRTPSVTVIGFDQGRPVLRFMDFDNEEHDYYAVILAWQQSTTTPVIYRAPLVNGDMWRFRAVTEDMTMPTGWAEKGRADRALYLSGESADGEEGQ
jgi:hypothetical protein